MNIIKSLVSFNEYDKYFLKNFGLMKASSMATRYKKTHKTPFIYDVFQLFGALGDKDYKFFSILRKPEKEYKPLVLKMKNGKIREIFAPSYRLKRIQRNILNKILLKYEVSPYAKAYIKTRRLYDNAEPHTNKKYILKLDITDFFGSITFDMVLSTVFNKNYYPISVGTALTTLCCYHGVLVQGAPTSPMLSNIIMKHFDDAMGAWCEKRGIAYTRYCDDITFSSEKPLYQAYYKAQSFLKNMGFELNGKKTHFVKNTQRQTVTGLVVNKKVSVNKEYKRTLRQDLYYFLLYGKYERKLLNSGKSYYEYVNSLLGRLAFVLSVEPQNKYFLEQREKLMKKIQN